MRKEDIIIGCCGFPVSIEKYVPVLDAVETQQTFYRLVPEKTAIGWYEKATAIKPDFQFSVKASQFITHKPNSSTYARAGIEIPEEKRANYGDFVLSTEVLEAWEHTLKIASSLHTNVILLQSPPTFAETPENLTRIRNFLERVRSKEYIIFWEYRGKWKEETVRELCQEFGIYHCIDPFTKKKPQSEKYFYYRLHGGERYSHAFTQSELEKLAENVKALEGEKVYIFFNNRTMFADAQRFHKLIKP